MNSRLVTLALLALGCATTQQSGNQPSPPADHGVAYRGGRWFDGTKFVSKTMYVAGGVFHTRAPVRIDSVVDLAGGYVVPPFSDAHQHLVDPRIDQTIAMQLGAGIFYLKDQGSAPVIRRIIDPQLNKPTTFDFIGANQAWTSPGGHPVEVIKRGAAAGPFAAFVRDSLDPALVMQVESPADIEQRWAYFLAGKPDFVKVHVYRSDVYQQRRNDTIEGNVGIDPLLVPEIVKRAKASGLQVSAHVFTAADFRVAVTAGVQQIAHLPGGRGPDSLFALTDADAAAAARAGVTVITTVTQHEDSALLARLLKTQYANNINVLRRHHVPLLIGSDLIGRTATIEMVALAGSGLFTNLELLRMWSVTTPQAIFPSRRIGALQDGYEASFLVLRGDPLADFAQTRAISMRVKQGVLLR
ncbi:MAG TPA: amidohydrolase family protein [Gemmatimonadales bacterium]|nr:amidohydrolase family protein [Gemmatimonadales bacterium]